VGLAPVASRGPAFLQGQTKGRGFVGPAGVRSHRTRNGRWRRYESAGGTPVKRNRPKQLGIGRASVSWTINGEMARSMHRLTES